MRRKWKHPIIRLWAQYIHRTSPIFHFWTTAKTIVRRLASIRVIVEMWVRNRLPKLIFEIVPKFMSTQSGLHDFHRTRQLC